MSRGDQLYRQWSILHHLSSGRKSRRELAQWFDVSLKTITRDIDALSLFPIVEEREGIDIFYSLFRNAHLPTLSFQNEEIAALLMGKKTALSALEGSPYQEAFASALTKVELFQKEYTYRQRKELPEVFFSSFPKPSIRNHFQELLTQAAIERRMVWMRYFTASRQEISEREIEPYILHLHPLGFSLIAYCLFRKAFLHFNVNLIQDAHLLDKTFDAEIRAFDLKEFLSSGFDGHRSAPILDVCLFIKNPTASWAKDHFFHPTQRIEEEKEGIRVSFRAGGSEAIVSRVLGLGEDCEVLSPPLLRNKVQEKVQRIIDLYEKKKKSP